MIVAVKDSNGFTTHLVDTVTRRKVRVRDSIAADQAAGINRERMIRSERES